MVKGDLCCTELFVTCCTLSEGLHVQSCIHTGDRYIHVHSRWHLAIIIIILYYTFFLGGVDVYEIILLRCNQWHFDW